MTTFGRPSWLDRAVDEALAACPTMQPWEVRVMLIAAGPTIQNTAVPGRITRIHFGATTITGLDCLPERRDHEVEPRVQMGNVVGFRCSHCAAMWTLSLVDSGIPR